MIKMKVAISLIAVQIVFFRVGIYSVAKPLVINTWNFLDAGQAGKSPVTFFLSRNISDLYSFILTCYNFLIMLL